MSLTVRTAMAAGVISLSASVAGAAVFTTVPNANESVSGGFGSPAPLRFNSFNSTTGSRNQQVYMASQFAGFDPMGNSISQIRFRPIDPAGVGGDSVTATNVVIKMSTTARTDAGPNQLSTSFAANAGADEVVVYSGPLTLTTQRTPAAGGTFAFDYVINLQTAFAYLPTNGNLLLDVLVPQGATVTGNGFFGSFARFDATSPALPNGTAGVTANSDATASSGTFFAGGTVTQFVSNPVPTPGGVALLGAGAIIAARRRRA